MSNFNKSGIYHVRRFPNQRITERIMSLVILLLKYDYLLLKYNVHENAFTH